MDSHTTQMTPKKDNAPPSSNPRILYPMPDNYSETDDERAINAIERLLAEKLKEKENN